MWAGRSEVRGVMCALSGLRRAFRWWEDLTGGLGVGVLSTAVRASRKRLDGVLYLARQLICVDSMPAAHAGRAGKLQQLHPQPSSDDIWSQNSHTSRLPHDPSKWPIRLHPVFACPSPLTAAVARTFFDRGPVWGTLLRFGYGGQWPAGCDSRCSNEPMPPSRAGQEG